MQLVVSRILLTGRGINVCLHKLTTQSSFKHCVHRQLFTTGQVVRPAIKQQAVLCLHVELNIPVRSKVVRVKLPDCSTPASASAPLQPMLLPVCKR